MIDKTMKKINILYVFLLLIVMSCGWVQAQSIGLRIADTTIVQGTVLDIPIYADSSLTGTDIYSYYLQLSYDPYYFKPDSLIASGTITQIFGLPTVNTSVSGLITITGVGTTPLEGKGKFIILRLKVINSGWAMLGFTDAKHNYFNEGVPSMITNSHSFYIEPAPTITISPDNSVISKGDHLQMSVYGGTYPYQWFVTNNNVAIIDQKGLLTAIGTGKTKVIAIDSVGTRDTSGIVEIRPIRLSVPENLTQWPGSTIDIPVLTNDLSGMNITSGSFQLQFDAGILNPDKIIQSGTMLESSNVFMNKLSGTVSVVFAGSVPLAGNDTLVIIRFGVLPKISGNSNISIVKSLFNENILAASTDGYFLVNSFPYRYVYPSDGSLIVGESMQFNVYGSATPPYKWSVSDTTVGTIDTMGILHVNKRGNVIVTVTDSAGAVASTNELKVFDTRIIVKDTSVCKYDQMMDYPITLESLIPQDSIFSLEGKISYDSNLLSFIGVDANGTSTQDWMYATKEKDGVVTIAASSLKQISKDGVLVKLRFLPTKAFVNGSWAGININNFSFNEGYPLPLFENEGWINGISGDISSVEVSTGTTTICSGDMVRYNAYVVNGGAAEFQWLKNGNEIPNANGDTLYINSLIDKDSISCRVISKDLCAIDSIIYSNAIVMTVHKPPLAPDSINGDVLVKRGSFNLIYSVYGVLDANGYIWCLPEGFTGMSDSSSIVVNVSDSAITGKIYVCAFNDCGIGISDSMDVSVMKEVGIDEISSDKAILFPNPFDEQLNLIFRNPSMKNAVIEVFDETGQSQKISTKQKVNEFILDFKDHLSGLYLIRVSYSGSIEVFKVIKK
jgi:hypothetical protein